MLSPTVVEVVEVVVVEEVAAVVVVVVVDDMVSVLVEVVEVAVEGEETGTNLMIPRPLGTLKTRITRLKNGKCLVMSRRVVSAISVQL